MTAEISVVSTLKVSQECCHNETDTQETILEWMFMIEALSTLSFPSPPSQDADF